MCRELKDLVALCQELEVPHQLDKRGDMIWLYIHGKKEWMLRQEHPRKYKDLYVPYIRVSMDDSGMLYTRHNGICGYMPYCKIVEIIKEEMAA